MKSYEEVKLILSDIEPSEGMYAKLDKEDIPQVEKLLEEPERWLAARAVFALSRMPTEKSFSVLSRLTDDPRVEVRVSLAASAKTFPPERSQALLSKLVDDNEIGVRKFAYESVQSKAGGAFIEQLNKTLKKERNEHLKEILQTRISLIKQTD